MGYIGNADPRLLFAENVRDDLVPNPPQSLFNLTQEVPGGYESNVFVFKRKHKFINVLSASSDVEFVNATTTLECNDSLNSVILNQIKVGDFIRISGAVNGQNNSIFEVLSVTYSDPSISFVLSDPVIDESGGAITIELSKDGFWEVLEPEVDYTITGVGPNYNKQIQLAEQLNEEDVCYVIHKGSATYNFVPSAKSVGPEQLQENLRNFFVDRFEGDGVETVFELSDQPVNTKAIVVSVDGVILDGDDVMDLPAYTGDWFLDSDPASGDPRPTETNGRFLTFTVASILGAQIRVLHLGFSTISRRASLSDGQVGAVPPGSIGTTEIANSAITNSKLSVNSVANSNLQNDSVDGNKILLNNNQNLRARRADTTPQNILRVDASNKTILESLVSTLIRVAAQNRLEITEDAILPLLSTIDLGSNSNKFRDAYFSGDVDVDGNVNGVDLTAIGTDLSILESRIDSLNNNRSSYTGLVPSGSMMMYAGASAPSGWLLCNGQSVLVSTYPDLHAAIGYVYGGAGANFNLPDMRQRFPLGKADAGEGSTLGASGGVAVTGSSSSIGHTHFFAHTHNTASSGILPDHTHNIGSALSTCQALDLFGHTHSLAGHTHSMNHIHYIEPHFHSISGNFNIRIPGAFGGGASAGSPPQFQNADSPLNHRFLFSASGGATPFDMLLDGAFVDFLKSSTRRWFTASVTAAESNPAAAGTGSQNGSNPVNETTNGLKTNPPVGVGAPGTGPNTPNTGAAVGNTGTGNAIITLQGNTSNPTPGTINSTGSTTSQSTSTTSEQSPPYRVLNYIIKV